MSDPTPSAPPPVGEMFAALYDDLRRVALGQLARDRAGHTLTATSLVNEAYVRLAGRGAGWRGRTHFLRSAAVAMRHILVSHARARNRLKRGGGRHRVELEELDLTQWPADDELLALDEALAALAADDPQAAGVVELRYFGGAGWDEVGEALGLSADAVRGQWAYAKAWLYHRLRGPAAGEETRL
jgi:RNA polymerase sigma factor (TIGR02999 family)